MSELESECNSEFLEWDIWLKPSFKFTSLESPENYSPTLVLLSFLLAARLSLRILNF